MSQNPLSQRGHVVQISSSLGGVPKQGIVGRIAVGRLGLEGDEHLDMVHHGGADRAICIYSMERIIELQREGHPIFPGSVGENLTIHGIDNALLEPGVRLRVGDELLLEVTSYTAPCNNIAESFAESKFSRISHQLHPGWSRLYARVLQTGSIQTGDAIWIDR
jgi:MOSC domain-containing protein YiiM